MTSICLGEFRYRLLATERGGHWVARAGRGPAGEAFGIECEGATEAEAVHRLARWLAWQHEHAAALESLRETERAYHRTIVDSAFAVPGEGATNVGWQTALEVVDAARLRLDRIRESQPRISSHHAREATQQEHRETQQEDRGIDVGPRIQPSHKE